jgi:hypothetical protein
MTSFACKPNVLFLLAFLYAEDHPQRMDLPEEHDATDSDRQPEDARTLVAALIQQLILEGSTPSHA